jgi:hypothetical protein
MSPTYRKQKSRNGVGNLPILQTLRRGTYAVEETPDVERSERTADNMLPSTVPTTAPRAGSDTKLISINTSILIALSKPQFIENNSPNYMLVTSGYTLKGNNFRL